jgi:hypothetical protein
MNWSNPNPGLYVDEFVAFAICFPILDLSWRMGEGSPTKSTFLRLYNTIAPDILQLCRKQLLDAGFSTEKRKLTLKLIEGRLDEYAATYLIDRQEEKWIYLNTRKQVARNCLAPDAATDRDGFMDLMEDVIDRSRGRVKKEFRKACRKVVWFKNVNGWEKRVQSFD